MRSGTNRQKRRQLLLWTVIAAAILGFVPLRRMITAVRLITMLRHVAAGEIGPDDSVTEAKVSRTSGQAQLDAILYRPSGRSPESGIILMPGVSELGCNHPRLVSLARELSKNGFLVLTPDIKMLRDFRIFPPPITEISFWVREARHMNGGGNLRRIGLAGISFSGTLALIAAAEPQNQSVASYVLAVGAFDDLLRCSSFWFDAGPITVGPGYYPTRFYAKWIIMLAAVDLLPQATDRDFIESVLRNLLLQKDVPALPNNLSEAGRRWHRFALMREDQSDADLARQIESHVSSMLYQELATGKPAAEIRCPVFLAHGAYDDLIPPEESRRLQKKITMAKSYLLISPFLTHTHASDKPLSWWTKTKAFFSLLGFFYHLSAAV
jgi:pimeloyl-ACP methyl ester carboxylesterase